MHEYQWKSSSHSHKIAKYLLESWEISTITVKSFVKSSEIFREISKSCEIIREIFREILKSFGNLEDFEISYIRGVAPVDLLIDETASSITKHQFLAAILQNDYVE